MLVAGATEINAPRIGTVVGGRRVREAGIDFIEDGLVVRFVGVDGLDKPAD